MKDFLSIKEFSELTGIEGTTLRYWDDIGLFSPTKRDKNNSYRYYTANQIIQVNFINVLNSLEIPLKTIAQVKNERSPESILDLIESQERVLDAKARQLRERLSVLNTRRWLIKSGLLAGKDDENIKVINLEKTNFVRGRRNVFEAGESFYRPFVQFCRSAKELRINLRFPVAGIHDCWSNFHGRPGLPDYWLSLDPDGNETRDTGDYVVGLVRGYYGDLGDIQERMAKYIKDNGINISGPVYTTYVHDEVCVQEPSEYLTMIAVAVSD